MLVRHGSERTERIYGRNAPHCARPQVTGVGESREDVVMKKAADQLTKLPEDYIPDDYKEKIEKQEVRALSLCGGGVVYVVALMVARRSGAFRAVW